MEVMLLLLTYRKSHAGFPIPLVPKLMTFNTVNYLEWRRPAVILSYFIEFGSFGANYVTV